jgi:hypothetical protein
MILHSWIQWKDIGVWISRVRFTEMFSIRIYFIFVFVALACIYFYGLRIVWRLGARGYLYMDIRGKEKSSGIIVVSVGGIIIILSEQSKFASARSTRRNNFPLMS